MIEVVQNNIKYKVIEHDIWQQINQNLWERHTFHIFDKFLKANDVYVDIGAWIGTTTLYPACKCRQIHAIEPDPVAFRVLQKNVKLNKLNNVTLHNIAIAGEDQKITMGARELGNSMTNLWAKENCFMIKGLTFDSFINQFDIKPDFIKMDIEGAEEFVLPVAKEYLKEYKPTVLLSLHFKAIENLDPIIDVISIYKNIYDKGGCRATMEKIVARGKKMSLLLLTENNWES